MRQFASADTQGNRGTQVLTVRFPNPTLAGSAIFAWSRSAIDGQTENFARFTDDKGNTYIATGDRQSDPDGRVNAAQATAYAANVAAGTSLVTATWNPFGDYRSIVIAEVTGVSAQPLIAHQSNIQRSTAGGTGNLTSGNFTVAVVPALVIAISTNESQTSGPPYAPGAGPNFQSLGTVTNYGLPADFARLEYRVLTASGQSQALFNAPAADEFLSFAVVFH